MTARQWRDEQQAKVAQVMASQPRLVADRAEDDYCERGTQSCCIDHTAERARDFPSKNDSGCSTW